MFSFTFHLTNTLQNKQWKWRKFSTGHGIIHMVKSRIKYVLRQMRLQAYEPYLMRRFKPQSKEPQRAVKLIPRKTQWS